MTLRFLVNNSLMLVRKMAKLFNNNMLVSFVPVYQIRFEDLDIASEKCHFFNRPNA